MINSEVILAGCRAYVDATGARVAEHPGWAENAARTLARGQTVPGMLTMTGPLLSALAAAVHADREQPVTGEPL